MQTLHLPFQATSPRLRNLSPAAATWQQWNQSPRRYAVCLLLIPPPTGSGPAQVVLTRRSTMVTTHKGQVGFAGGRAEAIDQGPVDTAIRELEEEMGVTESLITIHGMLPHITELNGSPIIPIVMSCDINPRDFSICTREVADVLTAPWTSLTRDCCQQFEFNLFGRWRHSYLFETPEFRIWGMTAKILWQAGMIT